MQVHDLHRGVDFLFGTQVVQLEFVVAICELTCLQHFHQLVLTDCVETLELFLQLVGDVSVEDGRHFEVHVQFELRGLLHVHVQVQPRDQVDVLGAPDRLPRLGVELAVLPEPLLLDDVLLEDTQNVSALVEHALLVGLLPLQLYRQLQVVCHAFVVLDEFPPLVGLRLDDLHQRVVLDLASEEHLLQFTLDAEGSQDALAQVEVLLNGDRELSFLFVHTAHAHLLEEHCLRK